MTEEEKRLHRCCFTGHRPLKLSLSETQARKWLEEQIDDAIAGGMTTFMTGMGMGVDLWAAETVLTKKAGNEAIRLIAVTPYPSFAAQWKDEWKDRYNRVWKAADYRVTMSDRYDDGAVDKRNVWLVDHACLVIAFYNGEAGSTQRMLDYAGEKEVRTVVFLDGKNEITEPYPDSLLNRVKEEQQWPEDVRLRIAIELSSTRNLNDMVVMEKRFMDGKALPTVAEEMNLSEDQVRQLITRMVKRLRSDLPFLQGEMPADEPQRKKEWLLAKIREEKAGKETL